MVAINDLYPQVVKVCRPLIVEDDVLKLLVKRFYESVGKALSLEHAPQSTVKCNLTHITDFPDGTEKGRFIGLEFSGRIFRLLHGRLKGDRCYTSESRLYEFPDTKLGEGLIKLVDYVARCVSNFIEIYDIQDKRIILGVASSFPMSQDSLQEGIFHEWSSSFQSNSLANQDFFTQLKISLKKFKSTKRIYLISLVSSATAYLLSGLYQDPSIRLGIYLGDETNITYVEKYKNMTAYTGDGLRTRTAIDVQMKLFGDDGALDFIRTDFDYQIDDASSNPGQFVLEKLTSSFYLGEITRLCLYELIKDGCILDGYISAEISKKGSLKTEDLAVMEMDEEKKFGRCRTIMRGLGYKTVSDSDCLQIRFVSRCAARRSSNLVAAYLTAMIQRLESKNLRIMGGGFLLKDFPNYQYYLVKKMNQLKKQDVRCEIIQASKVEVALGAGIAAVIYKDEIIKLEDKHRALPPMNVNKLNLKDIPASVIDCECEEEKRQVPNRPPTACDDKSDSQSFVDIFDVTEPVYASLLNLTM